MINPHDFDGLVSHAVHRHVGRGRKQNPAGASSRPGRPRQSLTPETRPGRADLNSDGFITAAERAAYVGPGVSALSRQTLGNLPGGEGGEFIFELHPETEALSQLSAQLDQEAIQLNAQLDQIRKQIAAKTARNNTLRRQIAAAKMDPKNALAANNAGFIYSKLQRFDESIQWTKQAIQIDSKRAVAYQNLGDLYYQLNRPDGARPYYEKYLDLAADKPYAATVRARLGRLNP